MNIINNSLFWIGIYLAGYLVSLAVIGHLRLLHSIRDRIPKNLVRIFAGLVFVAAPLAVPLTHSPKTGLNPTVTLWFGIILLIINFIIKYLCIKSIGFMPALREKKNLITTGIYSSIRNPLYSSNCMMIIGWALIFNSTYGLLFAILYSLLFCHIIFYEEKNLLKQYGREFEKYMAKVPWRLIPKVY
jgi:protein-S-isoprenylcysteine O-methyltransferase Ste14